MVLEEAVAHRLQAVALVAVALTDARQQGLVDAPSYLARGVVGERDDKELVDAFQAVKDTDDSFGHRAGLARAGACGDGHVPVCRDDPRLLCRESHGH